jgi:hypothetical protein
VLPPEAFAGAVWINAAGIALSVPALAYNYLSRGGVASARGGKHEPSQ